MLANVGCFVSKTRIQTILVHSPIETINGIVNTIDILEKASFFGYINFAYM